MDDKLQKTAIELLKETYEELGSFTYLADADGEDTTNPTLIELQNKIANFLTLLGEAGRWNNG